MTKVTRRRRATFDLRKQPVVAAAKMHMVAPRGDRIVAKAALVRQQRDMYRVSHAALKQYIRLVRRAVAHTAIRADASPTDDLSGLGPDVDLNALDQSHAWPAILKATILPQIDKVILGLGPQERMTPSVVSAMSAWRARWMHQRTQVLAGIPDTVTKQIRDEIQADSDLNGPNPRNAASIVQGLLDPDAPTWANRAMTIARTETLAAMNQGSLASYTAVHQSLSPVGGQVYKTWLATDDAVTREDHADIDGTEVSVSDTFPVGGSDMSGPGDDTAPADQTINCRCTLTFRVDDTTDDSDTDLSGDSDGSADDDDDSLTAAAPEAPVTAPAKTDNAGDAASGSDPSTPFEPKAYERQPDENVICPKCGKANEADAKFCDQCGFELQGAKGVVVDVPAKDAEAKPAAAPAPTATVAAGPVPDAPPQPADGTPSEAAPAAAPGAMQWSGVLATLDAPSSDGRMIAGAGVTVRPLPLPLSYQCEGEHGGEQAGTSVVVGRILTCTVEGGQVVATGDFFDPMTSDAPLKALEMVAGGIGGVSVDLPVQVVTYMAPGPNGALLPVDPMQYMGDPDQIIMVAEQSEIAGATIVNVPAFANARISLVEAAAPNLGPVTADAANPQGPILTPDSITFPDGTVLNVGDQINVIGALGSDTPTSGLIEAILPDSNEVTVAVEDPDNPGQTNSITVASTSLDVMGSDSDNTDTAASGAPAEIGGTSGGADGIAAGALTAAIAFPGLTEEHVYNAEWFSLPDLDDIERRPHIRVTEDGQVFGLLAQGGSCHIGFGSECVSPPISPTGYAYFHVGDVKTDQGFLPVGKITVGGGHADMKLGWRGAVEHYDNAGAAAAVVRAYDTEIGVVLAGALLPQATGEQVAALRRNDCSGDWRPIGGQRELVAALAVNVAGFQLSPRSALAADGRPLALVAAGVVHIESAPIDAKGVSLPSGARLTGDDVAVLAAAFGDMLDQRAQTRAERAAQARALKDRIVLRSRLRAV